MDQSVGFAQARDSWPISSQLWHCTFDMSFGLLQIVLACDNQGSRTGPNLRALATTVAILLAVAALHDALVDAVILVMTLLTAVAANIRRLGWALAAHVANLVTDVALDVGAWLWALKKS